MDEVARVLSAIEKPEHRLLAELLHGTGMRITEGLQPRVKAVEFDRGVILVREGKGGKDRAVMLSRAIAPSLREQLARSRSLWGADRDAGRSGVWLPDALECKYPQASASWSWFWVSPQATHSTDPRPGVVRRHHLYDQTFQRAFKAAVAKAGIHKPAMPRTLRHCFATRVLQFGSGAVRSPLDALAVVAAASLTAGSAA